MLDVITTSFEFSKKVRNCSRIESGIESDHDAVCAKIHMNSVPFKLKLAKEVPDYDCIQKDDNANNAFNEGLRSQSSQSYTSFMSRVTPTAESAATKPRSKSKGWFPFGGP